MSDPNNPDQRQGGGQSLGGSGPAEPLPTEWARRTTSGNTSGGVSGNGFSSGARIGRIGAWGGSSSSSHSTGASRFATLGDLGRASGPSMGAGPGAFGGMGGPAGEVDDDDDDTEGDEHEGGENWYAGGERSGISVENPDRGPRRGNNLVRDILRKAAEAGQPTQAPTAPSGSFSGSAYTLGSDDVESSFIPDPSAQQGGAAEDREVATRHITFWRDGFSVEDGPLLRYDDAANSQLLDEINSGHAPPQILNVRVGQPVELRVTRRLEEEYVPPPKRPMGAFEGQGHRLGAAVPDIVSSSTTSSLAGALDPPSVPGGFPSGSSQTTEGDNIQTRFEVDQTLPTTSVQVRLADGTRLVARMNLHHTVGDIRNFINASRPGSSSVPYTIQTTFPNKVLEDNAQTIEQAGLKNSVVVQRLV